MATKAKAAKANRPVHEVRLGRIRAAIWENQTETGTRHNVTFSRLYKDDKGQWNDSSSFGRDDLPLLAKVADRVHSWIFEQAAEQNGSNGSAQAPSEAQEEVHF